MIYLRNKDQQDALFSQFISIIILYIVFMFMGPCIVNQCQQMFKKMRLYTVHYISVNCSTCFGWYLHLSSGTHRVRVGTAFQLCHNSGR